MSEEDVLCAVCGGQPHGIHFKILTCRACAAFFRRSVGEISEGFRCRRATKDCEIADKSKQNCKFCRFKKCKAVGMLYEGSKFEECASEESPEEGHVGCPETADYENMAFGHNCLHYDSTPLMQKIKETLTQPPTKSAEVMQPMTRAYKMFRYRHNPNALEVRESVDFRIWMRTLENGIVKSARWAMSNAEFAALSIEDKWFLFQPFWMEFYTIEMVARSVDVCGDEEDTRFLFAENLATDLKTCKFDLPFDDRSKEAFYSWFTPHKEMMQRTLIQPLKAVRLTEFEVNYLLLQQLWSTERAEGLSEDAKVVGATVLHRASNELHRHFVREMRMENYAARLSKIVKLQSGLNDFVYFEKHLMKSGELFGIFKNEFMDCPLAAGF